MKKVTWEAARANTAKKMCKTCGCETHYAATKNGQMLGNVFQRIVLCAKCNNPFIEEWT